MNAKKIITGLAACAAVSLVAAAGITAFSFGLFAPVSGKQAAAAAVAHTGGYAEEVDFEYDYYTGSRYEVDTIADGRRHEVIVDAGSGKVLAVQAQYPEHDNG
ncbi:PepSY domain-containing protein [Neisseria sp. CCUG12390]|uniref:PepSY domain-containing protein n=1 Tax=Neisseria sp. CCUG12390 TaxID=3392035 RepID=UPI003A100E20